MIGDSRAVRVGGPPVPDPSPADAACGRSTDSLAAELGNLLAVPVLSLACPSATTSAGLLGPQERGGLLLPPQVGVLKQVQGLRFVAVAIGPNDLGWSDLVTYCYAVENCADNLSQGEFDYRLAAFDRDYGTLLAELAALPGQPQVVVMTSYDALPATADPACADLRGPAGSGRASRRPRSTCSPPATTSSTRSSSRARRSTASASPARTWRRCARRNRRPRRPGPTCRA